MGRIICIAGHESCVEKTTTTVNISTDLAPTEKKTLLIDWNPQGHAGFYGNLPLLHDMCSSGAVSYLHLANEILQKKGGPPMKITTQETIKNAEQDLIDGITAELDWEAIENIFREKHNLEIDENVELKKGDLVVHDGQVVYQLDFTINLGISVLLDRKGEYLAIESGGDSEIDPGTASPETPDDDAGTPQSDLTEIDATALPEDPPSVPKDPSAKKISEAASKAGKALAEVLKTDKN